MACGKLSRSKGGLDGAGKSGKNTFERMEVKAMDLVILVIPQQKIVPKSGNLNDEYLIHYQLPRILRPASLLAGHSTYTKAAPANAAGAPARMNAAWSGIRARINAPIFFGIL